MWKFPAWLLPAHYNLDLNSLSRFLILSLSPSFIIHILKATLYFLELLHFVSMGINVEKSALDNQNSKEEIFFAENSTHYVYFAINVINFDFLSLLFLLWERIEAILNQKNFAKRNIHLLSLFYCIRIVSLCLSPFPRCGKKTSSSNSSVDPLEFFQVCERWIRSWKIVAPK